jgi:hypothetical protein
MLNRHSGTGHLDDYDVIGLEGEVVGCIVKHDKPTEGSAWMWTLACSQHEDRTPTHGYEATREAAMASFAKSWRRECHPKKRVVQKMQPAHWLTRG